MSSQYLVIVGAPMESQKVVGPFACFDDADTWCALYLKNNEFTWIIPMYSPKEYQETQ